MKNILAFFVLLLLFFSPLLASAASLKFEWEYPAVTGAPDIVGFRLYRDGTTIDTDKIAPTARTVTITRQTDKKSHTYHLTAYSVDAESAPSNTAIDAYVAATVTPAGMLKIEVVP